MKKNFNRVLSMLIALVMVISLVPVVATAETVRTTPYSTQINSGDETKTENAAAYASGEYTSVWNGGDITWGSAKDDEFSATVAYDPSTSTKSDKSMDFSWYPGYNSKDGKITLVLASSLEASKRVLTLKSAAQYLAFVQMKFYTTINSSAYTTSANMSGYTIKLACDVNLNGATIPAINSYATFEGIFDGQGHIVYNFTSNGAGNNRSVFGTVGRGAEFKNVVYNGTIDMQDTSSKTGRGIIARVITSSGTTTKVENVTSLVTVSSTRGGAMVNSGGVVGIVEGNGNVQINNCTFNGTAAASFTSVSYTFGGIVGYVKGSANVTINNCVNNTAISAVKELGGIVGKMATGTTVTLNNCVNNGAITATEQYAGGMVGCVVSGASLTINGCSNNGTITASANADDIVPNWISVVTLGDQFKDNGNGTKDYRIVSLVYGYDATAAKNNIAIGYKFTITYEGQEGGAVTETYYCTTAYKAIMADGSPLAAADYDADFFVTMTIKNVPDRVKNIKVVVTPFVATSQEAVVDGTPGTFNWNVSAQ